MPALHDVGIQNAERRTCLERRAPRNDTPSHLVKGKNLGAGEGTFNHIAGGYDAGYYGYMYSLVFAADMYATVFKPDPLDPKRGKLYRDEILRPGGSRDEIDSLKVRYGRVVFERVANVGLTGALFVHSTSLAVSLTRRRSSRSSLAVKARAREYVGRTS